MMLNGGRSGPCRRRGSLRAEPIIQLATVSESGQPLLVPETGQLLLGARTRPLGYESRPGLTAGDLEGADEHAIAVGELARSYESPLVAVTGWYRAMRLAMTDCPPAQVAAAYRAAATALEGAGMPGLQQNLLPLALLTLRIKHDRPAPTDTPAEWGSYEPWVRPPRADGSEPP